MSISGFQKYKCFLSTFTVFSLNGHVRFCFFSGFSAQPGPEIPSQLDIKALIVNKKYTTDSHARLPSL